MTLRLQATIAALLLCSSAMPVSSPAQTVDYRLASMAWAGAKWNLAGERPA